MRGGRCIVFARMPRYLVIAGTASSAGKTTFTLGLMAALVRRGLRVAPFKTGPDFIDPGRHACVCGVESHNLDGWMCTREEVRAIFERYVAGTDGAGADVAIVEGAMGLYDGATGAPDPHTGEVDGSAAQVARWLDGPVLLVADVSSMAGSAAALARGYLDYAAAPHFAGVVANKVGSDKHRALLAEGYEAASVPMLGYARRDAALHTPSRHLGLVTAEDAPLTDDEIAALADWAEDALAAAGQTVEGLLDILPECDLPERDWPSVPKAPPPASPVRIAIARDAAFSFYYAENLRRLREAGAELVPFSPVHDRAVPPDVAGLYLGGGYPELAGFDIANNTAMRKSVRELCASGVPVFAECGGLLYLLEGFTYESLFYGAAEVVPRRAVFGPRFAALGYREATTVADSPLGPAGTVLRGHEFHYSRLDPREDDAPLQPAFAITDRVGQALTDEGVRGFQPTPNIVATYMHMHFGSNPLVAGHFVRACREFAS